MRLRRLSVVLAVVTSLLVVVASPALAQPANDTIEGAELVEFPFLDELDTTTATTDEVDAALNEECGAPATDASVWYSFTVEEDLGVEVFVGDSDYSAGVILLARPKS